MKILIQITGLLLAIVLTACDSNNSSSSSNNTSSEAFPVSSAQSLAAFVSPKVDAVQVNWSVIPEAVSYQLQITTAGIAGVETINVGQVNSFVYNSAGQAEVTIQVIALDQNGNEITASSAVTAMTTAANKPQFSDEGEAP